MTWVFLISVVALVGSLVARRVHAQHQVWHAIERPQPGPRDSMGYRTGYTGQLQVCVDRHASDHVLVVGTCDFDDDDALGELRIKAETRAAHLNSVRNST